MFITSESDKSYEIGMFFLHNCAFNEWINAFNEYLFRAFSYIRDRSKTIVCLKEKDFLTYRIIN